MEGPPDRRGTRDRGLRALWSAVVRSCAAIGREAVLTYRVLRRTRWWRWVGVAWAVLFILWPTAAYAVRVLG